MTHQSPHDKSADAVHEGRPVEAQYVRGGRGGVRILALLIVSAGAAAILLLGMWLVSNGGFARTNVNNGQQPADVQAFNQPAAAPPTADAPTGQPTSGAPNVKAATPPAPYQ
jgi:hypothetical protein